MKGTTELTKLVNISNIIEDINSQLSSIQYRIECKLDILRGLENKMISENPLKQEEGLLGSLDMNLTHARIRITCIEERLNELDRII